MVTKHLILVKKALIFFKSGESTYEKQCQTPLRPLWNKFKSINHELKNNASIAISKVHLAAYNPIALFEKHGCAKRRDGKGLGAHYYAISKRALFFLTIQIFDNSGLVSKFLLI